MLRKIKPYIEVLPALLATLILFWGGIFYGIFQSFGMLPIVGESRLTFGIYFEVMRNKWFLDSLLFTLKIAGFSTFLSSLFAMTFLTLLFMYNDKKIRISVYKKAFTMPMLIPYLVSGYLISILFMQSGWISSIMQNLGLIKEIWDFPVLTNEKNGYSIIFTYVWKTSPFLVLMSYPVMMRVQDRWLEVAQVFGAYKFEFFTSVALPLMLPSFISSLFIIFAYIFSSFEVPYLLGVTHPKTLSVLSYEIYSKGELYMRPYVMVINVLISSISIGTGIFVYYINKKYVSKNQRGWA